MSTAFLWLSVGERSFYWLCNLEIEESFLSFAKKSSIAVLFGLTGVQEKRGAKIGDVCAKLDVNCQSLSYPILPTCIT